MTAAGDTATRRGPDSADRCNHCGLALGAYEPVWIELVGGRAIRADACATAQRPPTGRAWHAGCMGRATMRMLRPSR